jgi:hypothetical protein
MVAVASVPDANGYAVLGDSFMRNFNTVFDYGLDQVMFSVNSKADFGQSITTGGLSTGWIVCISCVSGLVFILIVLTLCLWCRGRGAKKTQTNVVSDDASQPDINQTDASTLLGE